MSIVTMRYAESHEVVGRYAELERIRATLAQHRAAVLLLDGESGIGKTAIANRVVEMARAGSLAGRFDQTRVRTIYKQSWGRVLAELAVTLLDRATVLKATERELERMLLDLCARERILVVIDNIDPVAHHDALPFIEAWAEGEHDSVLTVTSVRPVPVAGPRVERLEIAGLPQATDQVELLGAELRQRFGDETLSQAVAALAGVPLNLLYLRWLQPQDRAELESRVNGLVDGTLDKSSTLTETLFELAPSTTYFMALGVVRQLQFDEALLAYLWDCMGGGNAAAYVVRRERFLEARLLTPVRGNLTPMYRLSEAVHKHLYRALVPAVGEWRIPTFHYFVGEFFRNVFEQSDPPDVQALDAFVQHCFARGDHARAYEYLFEGDLLAGLHQAGMALQLRDVLEAFLEHKMQTPEEFSSALDAFVDTDHWLPLQKCRVLLELAHVCSDLGDYKRSLALIGKAEALLALIGDETGARTRRAVERDISYYSAIAFSNTGRSNDSLRSYFRIVANSDERDPFACLALGYLAHCALKYHDLAQAQAVGVRAVDLARETGDVRVLVKNLCSVGETHIYAGNTNAARMCFEKAHDLTGDKTGAVRDRRELGRLLTHWGVLEMVEAQLDEAERLLVRGRSISVSVNDRRRAATSEMYLGILDHANGDLAQAEERVLSATTALRAQRDGRYFVPAVLTYYAWVDPSIEGTLAEITAGLPPRLEHRLGGPTVLDPRHEVFARYWREHFRPTLLNSGAS